MQNESAQFAAIDGGKIALGSKGGVEVLDELDKLLAALVGVAAPPAAPVIVALTGPGAGQLTPPVHAALAAVKAALDSIRGTL